jgi:hypothetical protein
VQHDILIILCYDIKYTCDNESEHYSAAKFLLGKVISTKHTLE